MKPSLQQVGGRDLKPILEAFPPRAAPGRQQGSALCVASLQTELWRTKLFLQDLDNQSESFQAQCRFSLSDSRVSPRWSGMALCSFLFSGPLPP